MIQLEMLSNIEKQLAKASSLLNSSTVVFEDLSIIIIIENFNQIFIIINYFLWDKPQIDKNYNNKTL